MSLFFWDESIIIIAIRNIFIHCCKVTPHNAHLSLDHDTLTLTAANRCLLCSADSALLLSHMTDTAEQGRRRSKVCMQDVREAMFSTDVSTL